MSAPGQETPAPTEAAPEATENTTTTTEAPQSDGLERLYTRMEEMATQQRSIVDQLSSLAPSEEPTADEADYYDDDGGLTEDGARALIADLVREQVDTQMAPREQARMLSERDDAFEALKDEYPELADATVANRVLGRAVRWAQGVDEKLIDRPEFVEVIESFFKAEKFEELRQAQEAEQPRQVVLESAQGAARQQRPQEPDWQKRVIDAAAQDSPRI
jgi:hypothetical protein